MKRLLKRLDAYCGTPRRFEGLLCWGIVAFLAVCVTGMAGCALFWGGSANWPGNLDNVDGIPRWLWAAP